MVWLCSWGSQDNKAVQEQSEKLGSRCEEGCCEQTDSANAISDCHAGPNGQHLSVYAKFFAACLSKRQPLLRTHAAAQILPQVVV